MSLFGWIGLLGWIGSRTIGLFGWVGLFGGIAFLLVGLVGSGIFLNFLFLFGIHF